MSPVDITVRTGNDNIARAGSGKAAKTASSTSDAVTAAYRAAAKYFALPESAIAVECLAQRSDTTRFVARPLVPRELITTITFEDHGQDFLEWRVTHDGIVITCAPFQGFLWKKAKVLNVDQLTPGMHVRIRMPYESGITQIVHLVEKVSARPWSSVTAPQLHRSSP